MGQVCIYCFREYYFLDNDVLIIRENPYEDDFFTEKVYQVVRDRSAHRDACQSKNLGRIIAVMNATGGKLFEAEYDAWGNQTVTRNDIRLSRGYTGHEMLRAFGLIHMDGRVYDPVIGRFLSPDNYVQLPENSQSFNRYSYCLNNPLKYTDPSGEIFSLAFSAILTKVMLATMPSIISNLANGDNGWAAIGKGILSGAMSYGIGSALQGIAGTFGGELLRAGAHGVSGGVMNAINGGNFGVGFITGAAASFAGYGAQKAHFSPQGVAGATTLAGGLASWACGGDFFDGAMTGFSIGMMNENLHPIDGGELPEYTVIGKKPLWMRVRELFEPVANVAGELSKGIWIYDYVSKNSNIGSNKKVYFRHSNNKIFHGNQYVKTNKLPKIPHATAIGLGLDVVTQTPDLASTICRYGFFSKQTGRAVTVATGTIAGGYYGAQFGSSVGAAAGTLCCEGIGTFIGGFAGGLSGGIYGGELGGNVAGSMFDVIF